MNSSILKKFRIIGIAEGISYLVLLFVAMPLKYIFGFAIAVKIIGMIHGILFIGYVAFLALCMKRYSWNLKYAFVLFIASLIPFGTFYTDKELKNKEESLFAIETNN